MCLPCFFDSHFPFIFLSLFSPAGSFGRGLVEELGLLVDQVVAEPGERRKDCTSNSGGLWFPYSLVHFLLHLPHLLIEPLPDVVELRADDGEVAASDRDAVAAAAAAGHPGAGGAVVATQNCQCHFALCCCCCSCCCGMWMSNRWLLAAVLLRWRVWYTGVPSAECHFIEIKLYLRSCT